MPEELNILNELQQDVLTEVFNMGMGSAAASLSEMVGEEVQLTVPEISFVNKYDAIQLLSEQAVGDVSGVSQEFSGPLGGVAMLMFPIDKSLEIVRLLLQDTVSLDKLTEFEEEALCEIGNIIINSGLSSLADVFEQEMQSSLPVFSQGSCEEVMNGKGVNEKKIDIVMFLKVDFKIEKNATNGYVVYLLDVNSIKNLTENIDRYLNKLNLEV